MPSLRLSSLISKLPPDSAVIRAVTWLVRIAVGATFIFSGFVKAIDPWGTLYKVQDYLGVLGLGIWPNMVVAGVFILCAVEFFAGSMLILGCFRRSVTWLVTAIMCFMLPVTLWIAVENPVSDCGCFGDALVISNWATFWKNVFLTMGALWLNVYNRHIASVIRPAIQWMAFVATSIYILVVAFVGYNYQPLLDFRDYRVGTPIYSDDDADDSPEYTFIYEKDGVKKEFSQDDALPDESEGWKFVERKETESEPPAKKTGGNSSFKAFRIWDRNGDEDLTEEILSSPGDRLILFMPDLDKVSPATTWKINSLYTWASRNDIDMIAVVAGSPEEIDSWEDLSMPEYEIFTADDTAIKEVARGNPSVVMTRDNTIMWKSSLAALNIDDFLSPGNSADPMSFARDDDKILLNLTGIYLAVILFLIALSYSTRLRHLFTRGDKAPRAGSSSHDKSAQ